MVLRDSEHWHLLVIQAYLFKPGGGEKVTVRSRWEMLGAKPGFWLAVLEIVHRVTLGGGKQIQNRILQQCPSHQDHKGNS